MLWMSADMFNFIHPRDFYGKGNIWLMWKLLPEAVGCWLKMNRPVGNTFFFRLPIEFIQLKKSLKRSPILLNNPWYNFDFD